MALSIQHAATADGTFSTTGATNWNANHTLTGQVDLTTQVTGTLPAGNGGTGITALGTGVATALAINVGTAGAFLTSNAAPSYPVTVAGTVTSGGIPYFSSTTVESSSALLAQYGVVVGGGAGAAPATSSGLTFGGAAAGTGLAIAAGTATTAVNAQTITQTWNEGSTKFTGKLNSFTSTASASTSLVEDWQVGGVSVFSIRKDGAQNGAGGITNTGNIYAQNSSLKADTFIVVGNSTTTSSLYFGSGTDAQISRAGANQMAFSASGSGGGGTATSRAEINKNVTAIANNTGTATLTVTILNAAHSAGGKIIFKGAAGAGGAIGADEFTALIEYDWTVTRTTGVNAVATLSTALLTAITSSVAGGATPTIAAALSAISGAVGATNTFTFNVTINALTGASTNHTCFCYATLINDAASGVTNA